MADVSLYGHLTLDRVFTRSYSYCSVGSIGNVWKTLNKECPKLSVDISPTDFGEALIYVDEDKCERSSIANLSNYVVPAKIKESKWHHVLYLNELKDTSFVSSLEGGIVSADICAGSKLKDTTVLSHIDFLFISDEDLFLDLIDLGKLVRGWVIMHHPGGSKWTDGVEEGEHSIEKIENVNVLGCGDMFVAHFINNFLNSKDELSSIIKRCHSGITKTLQEQNGN